MNKQDKKEIMNLIKYKKMLGGRRMELEEWIDMLPDYPKYQINKNGEMRNKKTQRKLKPFMNKWGYLKYVITHKGKSKDLKIHRLLAKYFIPNPDNKPQVNHINGIKTDNRIENLEWVTARENVIHAWEHGLAKCMDKDGHGYRSMKIICIDKNGNQTMYHSEREASKKLGISNTAINNCLAGRSKTAGGYFWKYATKRGENNDN